MRNRKFNFFKELLIRLVDKMVTEYTIHHLMIKKKKSVYEIMRKKRKKQKKGKWNSLKKKVERSL